MGNDVGFMLMPGAEAGADPVSLGGESLAFAVTSKSDHADVGAAYIDFLTNSDAAKVLAETGNLPAMPVDEAAIPKGLSADVFAAWGKLAESDGLIPYLDYATPTFFDDISAAIQELLAGKVDPAQFISGVQGKYQAFTEAR
jgi:raffinose/stachyose/melibiose transport system substrate-binding protein